MIITKNKQSLYFGLKKVEENIDAVLLPELSKKGIVFEFESLTNAEGLELSYYLGKLFSEDGSISGKVEFLKYAQSLVKGIHNKAHIPEDFGLDAFIPLMTKLFEASTVSEDDSYFLD